MDKIGINEFLIREYDSHSPDKVGKALDSNILQRSVFHLDLLADSTFKRPYDSLISFLVSQRPDDIIPGTLHKDYYGPANVYSLCVMEGGALNGSSEPKYRYQNSVNVINEDWFSFNETLLISLQRGTGCLNDSKIFTPRRHEDFVFLTEIRLMYNQWTLNIFLPYQFKFQQLLDFEGNLIDINVSDRSATYCIC